MKNQLIGKDPDAGKDRRLEKEAAEDEVAGLHHGLNGREWEQTPRDSGRTEGPGALQSVGLKSEM